MAIPSTSSLPFTQARSLRSNVRWSLLGYFVYGVCQWLMLVVVARLGLPEMVGQFALAMTVTTPFILLLGLDLRTIQATDQTNRHSMGDLLTLRLLLLAIALLAILGVSFWGGYPRETIQLILVMGLAKCIESISDLCHGTMQQHERLEQMAKARILRGVVSVAALAAGLAVFHSLMLATLCLAAVWIGILVCYDWPMASRLLQQDVHPAPLFRSSPQLWALLVHAIPTGLLACQASLEQNLLRLCVYGYLGERELGIFSAVASLVIAPTMIINAAHSAVLPRMAKLVATRQWSQTWQLIANSCLYGAALGVMGVLAAWACGGWALRLAFGPEYASQSPLLLVLMCAAMLRFVTRPFAMGIRAARQFWLLAVLQGCSLAAAVPILIQLVEHYGSFGAAYATVALAILFAALQIPATWLVLRATKSAAPANDTGQALPAETDVHEAA